MNFNELGAPEVFEAIRAGRIEVVRAYLMSGESPEAATTDGWTLLHEAAGSSQFAIVSLLLEFKANINAIDTNLVCPLWAATQAGSYAAVKVLLAAGASVDVASRHGTTALHKAAMVGEAEIADLLIQAGANVGLVSKGYGGTPLHMAVNDPRDCNAASDRAGVVQLLIASGAYVDSRDEHALTPLHKASRECDELTADLLLRAGADPNAFEEHRQTPLHLAAIRGSVGVTRLLLRNGADVEARDRFGETPLHRAAGAGMATVVRLLRRANADIRASSAAGLTPREVLRCRLLGGDPDARAKYGWRGERTMRDAAVQATFRALAL